MPPSELFGHAAAAVLLIILAFSASAIMGLLASRFLRVSGPAKSALSKLIALAVFLIFLFGVVLPRFATNAA